MHFFLTFSPSHSLLLAFFTFLLFPAVFTALVLLRSADSYDESSDPESEPEPPEPTRPRAEPTQPESEADEPASQERELNMEHELDSGRIPTYINGKVIFLNPARPRPRPEGITITRRILRPIPEGINEDENEGEELRQEIVIPERRRIGFRRRVLRGFRRVFTCVCF